MTEEKYRKQVLSHLEDTAHILQANVEMNTDSKEKEALSNFVGLISKLVGAMDNVKNDQAFIAVVKGLEMVLQKEFFDQVSQSRQSQTKQPEAGSAAPEKKRKQNARIASHLAVDPDELPKDVQNLIAEELKRMGVPSGDVDEFFGLN